MHHSDDDTLGEGRRKKTKKPGKALQEEWISYGKEFSQVEFSVVLGEMFYVQQFLDAFGKPPIAQLATCSQVKRPVHLLRFCLVRFCFLLLAVPNDINHESDRFTWYVTIVLCLGLFHFVENAYKYSCAIVCCTVSLQFNLFYSLHSIPELSSLQTWTRCSCAIPVLFSADFVFRCLVRLIDACRLRGLWFGECTFVL